MKTVLWSMLCLFLSGWGSMQAVLAQDLKEMEKNLSAINEELSQKTKEYSWQLAAAYADYCEANNKYGSSSNLVVISFLFQLSSSFLILLKVVDMFAF